jgi:hypothetical protein
MSRVRIDLSRFGKCFTASEAESLLRSFEAIDHPDARDIEQIIVAIPEGIRVGDAFLARVLAFPYPVRVIGGDAAQIERVCPRRNIAAEMLQGIREYKAGLGEVVNVPIEKVRAYAQGKRP